MEILQGLLDNLTALLAAHPLAGEWYMAFVRFLFPALAVLILYRAVRSLLRIPHTPENWGQLSLPNGTSLPLTHWENILGRSKTADIYLNYPSISRQHAALCRGEDENWTLYDLGSKGGTAVNGEKVASSVPVKLGDTITLGGVPLIFLPQTVAEREEQEAKRRAERPAAIWPSFLWLTVFQVLACLQLLVAAGTEATIAIPLAFLGLTVLMWLYYAALRATRCVGFEMETIAFFLSTLSLSITASSAQSSLFKQFLAILLGLALFLVLGLFLRDLSRVQKNRWPAGHHPGDRQLQIRRRQLDLHRRHVLPAVGDRQDLLYLRRRRHTGAAVPQAEPDPLHRVDRRVYRPAGPDERLRHRGHFLRHLPGDRLYAVRGFRHTVFDLRRRCVWSGYHFEVQALYPQPLRLLGPRLGGRLHHRLPADPHHVRRRLRGPFGYGGRQRLAP